MNERNYLTTRDAAEQMGVSVSSVRRLIRRRELQARRVSGVYRIQLDELDRLLFKRWLQERQVS